MIKEFLVINDFCNKITAKVVDFKAEEKKISLSMKALIADEPEETSAEASEE